MNLLPALVEAGEGFAAAEDLFIRRETETGDDAMTQIGATADECERQGLRKRRDLLQVLRAREQPARSLQKSGNMISVQFTDLDCFE